AWINQAKTNAVVLPNMTFKTGDMLVCKRQDANTPCTADQFQWADSSTGVLSSTRPASPKVLNAVSALTRKCNSPGGNGAPPDARYDLPSMVAKLSTPVDLYGDLSHGPTSKSNPAEFPARSNAAEWADRRSKNLDTAPFTVYFSSNGGTVTSGDRLDAQIKIDASNYIFLENLTSLDANTTDAEIIKAMTTKEFWAWEKLGIGKLGDGLMLGADLKVKVSKSATVDEIYAKPVEGSKASGVTPL
ncbi:hypothetical protein EBR21_04570, partial [bacterium]|nr:hypothetical protein [bacterium]